MLRVMCPLSDRSPAVSDGNQHPICVWTDRTFSLRVVTELNNSSSIQVTVRLHSLAAKLLILRTPVP